jgi:DNA-binding HxlR family transcriptional regulator
MKHTDLNLATACQTYAMCPMQAFLDVLSGPWTLYMLWILSAHGPTRFGAMKRQIQGISAKVLTERLRMLELRGVVYREYEPTVPPQVTYGLTERGRELMGVLDGLNAIAEQWYEQDKAALPAAEVS